MKKTKVNNLQIKFDSQKQLLYWIPFTIILLLTVSLLKPILWMCSEAINEQSLIGTIFLLTFISVIALALTVISYMLLRTIYSWPAYLVDEHGLTDVTKPLFIFGFISWEEIESIRSAQLDNGTGFIYIEPKNPNEFIKKQSFVVRIILRCDKRYNGSTIVISTRMLEGHFQPVVDLIKSRWLMNR